MRFCLALWALLSVASACHAGEIRRGATMQVKPDSMWFEDRAKLMQWQAFRKAHDTQAFASYQEGLLHAREAWQFSKPLSVKVRGFEPKMNLVDVELRTEGRLQGSRWTLDASAIVR